MTSAQTTQHKIFHYLVTAVGGLIKGVAGAIVWFFIGAVGFLIFDLHISPFDLLFGLPLLLIGVGMGIQEGYQGLVSVVSPKDNRLHCRLCQE